jgi:hypothetical protein
LGDASASVVIVKFKRIPKFRGSFCFCGQLNSTRIPTFREASASVLIVECNEDTDVSGMLLLVFIVKFI